MLKLIRFTVDDAQSASDEWRFNCGPGALCAMLNMTPAEIRPHLQDFESKGYTNPTLMRAILDGMDVRYRWDVIPETYPKCDLWPDNSLIRIQWAGPWTEPLVPKPARYRHTHWIGCRHNGTHEAQIFDVNATCVGGWMPIHEWTDQLVPWLLRECEPKADGRWWQTHRCVLIPKGGVG
jgi:hypothetical protein